MAPRCLAILMVCVTSIAAMGQNTESDKEALAVVDRAIKAAGGAAKLDRLKSITMKIKGPVQSGIQVVNFAGECSFADFDRLMVVGKADDEAVRMVMTPTTGWLKHGTTVEEAHSEVYGGVKSLLFATRAATMLTPLKDKAFTLSLGGEAKVGERVAVILKAKHKDHGAMEFHFDKETGLPMKVKTQVKILVNESISFAGAFADFQEVDGLKHFGKITIDMKMLGQKMSFEATLSDIKTAVELKEERFAKPE